MTRTQRLRPVVQHKDKIEREALQEVAASLKNMGIDVGKMICGRAGEIRTDGDRIFTRALMIADLKPEQSVRLQQQGLGAGIADVEDADRTIDAQVHSNRRDLELAGIRRSRRQGSKHPCQDQDDQRRDRGLGQPLHEGPIAGRGRMAGVHEVDDSPKVGAPVEVARHELLPAEADVLGHAGIA